MLTNLKNKINLMALAIPAFAADIELKTKAGSGFSNLEGLSVGRIISGSISLVLVVVSVVFFFILVIGGLKWITSGGDEKKVAAARSQITNALIGLAIVFASWAIMTLIGKLFGITIFGGDMNIPDFTGGAGVGGGGNIQVNPNNPNIQSQ